MIETKSKIIDDVEFRTTQLPAMRAYPLFIRLVKTIGPALAALQAADVGLDTELSSLGPVLGSALSGLEPDEATRLMTDLLVSTRAIVNGKIVELSDEAGINKVFTGRLPLLFKVLGFAAQENFAGFLAGSGSAPTAPDAQAVLS